MDEIIIVLICLVLNAIFAAYEMAFVSIPKSELRSLAKKGNKAAISLLSLKENPERTLSIIQIGITLVGAIAAAIGGAGASDTIEPLLMQRFGLREITAEIIAVIMIVIPLTYLSVVIGELVPKTLALRNPSKIVLAGAKWIFIADRLLAPFVSVLEGSTKFIVSVFFRKAAVTPEQAVTSIEIDTLSPVHQKLVLDLVNLQKKRVKDISLSWEQVIHIRITDSIESITAIIFKSGHTRLPVVDENGKVMGILHTKEFLAMRETGDSAWKGIIRQPLTVFASDSVLGVMRLMQAKRSHMTIAALPSGKVLGILTLEDILEEIVGDIFDEDDDGRIQKLIAAKSKNRIGE